MPHSSYIQISSGYIIKFYSSMGFPESSPGKESICNAGDPGLISGSGRSTGEGISYPLRYPWAFLVTQLVKHPPAMCETWIRSLGWEDPLEKGNATHSSIQSGEFHGLHSPCGHQESDTTEQLSLTSVLSKPRASMRYHSVCWLSALF